MIVNQNTKNSTFKMIFFFVPTNYRIIACHSPSLFKNLVKNLETITMNHVKRCASNQLCCNALMCLVSFLAFGFGRSNVFQKAKKASPIMLNMHINILAQLMQQIYMHTQYIYILVCIIGTCAHNAIELCERN